MRHLNKYWNGMRNVINKYKSWLFAKDAFDILLFALAAYGAQLGISQIFGEALAPPIGMTYISKSIASIAAASILIWGSWTIFKIILGFCTDYFEFEFIEDIKLIRSCSEIKSIHMFLRPLFFLALYFAFMAVVIAVAAASLF